MNEPFLTIEKVPAGEYPVINPPLAYKLTIQFYYGKLGEEDFQKVFEAVRQTETYRRFEERQRILNDVFTNSREPQQLTEPMK